MHRSSWSGGRSLPPLLTRRRRRRLAARARRRRAMVAPMATMAGGELGEKRRQERSDRPAPDPGGRRAEDFGRWAANLKSREDARQ